MPRLEVNTNVAKVDVPEVLLSEATNELAKAMGAPLRVGTQLFIFPRVVVLNLNWVTYTGK